MRELTHVSAARRLGWLSGARRRLVGSDLVRWSAVLLGSTALSRLLGFGFSVVAARALGPTNFGVVTYALALANIASILLFNSPAGLGRALARAPGDRREQNAIASNYLVIVTALLVISMVAAVPIGLAAGLEWLVFVGLLANLVGTTTMSMYRELQRGRERFAAVAVYNPLANLIQLVAVVSFLLLAWNQPGPYVIAFGLSSVVAVLFMQPFSRLGIRFVRAALDRARTAEVLRFVIPMVVQTAFFMVWSGADVVLLEAFSRLDVVGEYGAAKSLSNAAFLAGTAVATALLPQASRLSSSERRAYFRRLLLLMAGITVPSIALIVILAPWLLGLIFGHRYQSAAPALQLLTMGMGMYGVTLTLEASWIAIGRPRLSTAATAVAAVVTVATAPVLIPLAGMVGAALAFALGSGARLLVLGVVTAGALRTPARSELPS